MLVKINVKEVQMGMHIHEICGSWLEHPFWRTQFLLDSESDLKRLRESGISELWVDTSKGISPEPKLESTTEAETIASVDAMLAIQEQAQHVAEVLIEAHEAPQKISIAEEMKQAAEVCQQAEEQVKHLFTQARLGKALDTEGSINIVEEISHSIFRNPNALISLARIKTKDDYTYLHSVAVCALMISLSRQLGLDEKMVQTAGLGGLLHDIGKIRIPLAVLNKPSSLTEDEFAIVQGHPSAGFHILQHNGGFPQEVLEICLHHHEKVDGSGYPDKLTGDRISLMAKMGAVCDVYDAITSDRPYKVGWRPGTAIRKMAEWSKGHFDEKIFHAFVKAVGIYPTGSLVKLSSGHLAVVCDQEEGALLKPVVKLVYSIHEEQRIDPEHINLSHHDHEIVSQEDPARWGFQDIDEIWRD